MLSHIDLGLHESDIDCNQRIIEATRVLDTRHCTFVEEFCFVKVSTLSAYISNILRSIEHLSVSGSYKFLSVGPDMTVELGFTKKPLLRSYSSQLKFIAEHLDLL